MKNIEELHKLCEKAMDSIAESNKKLSNQSERLSAEDAKYLDNLAHMVKSIKTIPARVVGTTIDLTIQAETIMEILALDV